jgi:hypothetical protein
MISRKSRIMVGVEYMGAELSPTSNAHKKSIRLQHFYHCNRRLIHSKEIKESFRTDAERSAITAGRAHMKSTVVSTTVLFV